MNAKPLLRIRESLETALTEIARAGLKDRDIRHVYSEFRVASLLADRGHSVQVLGEREVRSADIYLPHIRKRVEVKSCKAYEEDGQVDWAYASFAKGNQIKNDKFDYCVFVVFDRSSEKVRTTFVFTKDELKEVANIRENLVAAHQRDTNFCFLCCAPTLEAYQSWGVKPFRIERDLLRHPKKYLDAWDKIK